MRAFGTFQRQSFPSQQFIYFGRVRVKPRLHNQVTFSCNRQEQRRHFQRQNQQNNDRNYFCSVGYRA